MTTSALPISRWVLRDQRRSLILWAIAIGAVSAMYMAFYPSMANEDMESLIAGLPEALRVGMGWDAIATGAGYLESTVYGLLAPALLLVFGISHGARLLVGEEESGTLELESAAPVSRTSLALQRFGALAVSLAVLCAALAAISVALAPALDMGIPTGNILAASLGLWLFVVAMAAVTYAAGAVTGSKSLTLAVGSAVAVLSYIGNALAPMVSGADWLERVSPFGWYLANDPLGQGADWRGMVMLGGMSALVLAIGLVAYNRRDLGG